MKGRFRLTREASADLREILLDIASDSPDIAERLRSEFYEALRRLAQSPGMGHYHEELLDPSLSLLELLLLCGLLCMAEETDPGRRRRSRRATSLPFLRRAPVQNS